MPKVEEFGERIGVENMRKLLCYKHFRMGVFFFEKSFRVPKIVPKLIGEIVEDGKLLLYYFPMTTITAANIVDMF